MTTLPKHQRAWIIYRRGRPQTALALRDDWDVPSNLKHGEVLVKVHAAALNPMLFLCMPFFDISIYNPFFVVDGSL